MEIKKFYEGIKLMPQAVAELDNVMVSEETYKKLRNLFYEDQERFFGEIKARPDNRILFLYYYCRMASEVYEKYMENNWEEEIYWNTFSDITIWCGNCLRDYGMYGIAQYDWLFRHVKLKLFRLGRLQYEICQLDRDIAFSGGLLRKGETVIHIHIPQGEPLNTDACAESVKYAARFFRGCGEIPYVCHSWLLYPGLKEILPENSNILCFQNLFELAVTDFDTREAEERIFIKTQSDPSLYPANTVLQKKARAILMEGKKLGSGFGVLR